MSVEFTEYALGRMHLRDILEEEVLEALQSPPSRHRHRKDGRSEVKARIGAKTLLVVYRLQGDDQIIVNAMWET
jgi:hypothetical protein